MRDGWHPVERSRIHQCGSEQVVQMRRSVFRFLTPVGVGTRVVTIGLLGALAGLAPSQASAEKLYVSPLGTDRFFDDSVNRCLSRFLPCGTIAHALTRAGDGDEIALRTGEYIEDTIVIDEAISNLRIIGGYDADFSSRSFDSELTLISGNDDHQIFRIGALNITVGVSFEYLWLGYGKAERGGAVAIAPGGGGTALVTFNRVNLTLNRAEFEGGAIYASNSYSSSSPGTDNQLRLTLTGSRLLQNTAWGTSGGFSGGYGYGGAIYVEGFYNGDREAELDLRENTFAANKATRAGNSIFLRVDTDDALLTGSFKKNVITSIFNSDFSHGELEVAARKGDIELDFENNQIYGGRRRGISYNTFTGGSITAVHTNDTITGNREVGIHAAAESPDFVDVEILNSIVWGNGSGNFSDLVAENDASIEVDYSDIGSARGRGSDISASSNFSQDPLFESFSRTLSRGSPAIDSGICTVRSCSDPRFPPVICQKIRVAPLDDFEGDSRPFGEQCDVGADEYVPEPSSLLQGLASLCTLLVLVRRQRVR